MPDFITIKETRYDLIIIKPGTEEEFLYNIKRINLILRGNGGKDEVGGYLWGLLKCLPDPKEILDLATRCAESVQKWFENDRAYKFKWKPIPSISNRTKTPIKIDLFKAALICSEKLIYYKSANNNCTNWHVIHFISQCLAQFTTRPKQDMTTYKHRVIVGVMAICAGYHIIDNDNPSNSLIYDKVTKLLKQKRP